MGRVLRIAFLTMALTGSFGRASEAAAVFNHLAVRIYDLAGVVDDEGGRVLERAGDILQEADVDVDWRDCSPRLFRPHAACASPPASGELIVRLVRAPGVGASGTLGEALIDTTTGTGVLATVFVDRIEVLATIAKANVVSIVGRVIAHEIGHLLLGDTAHGDTGLMRQLWSLTEFEQNRDEDWVFSRADVDRLRRRQRQS